MGLSDTIVQVKLEVLSSRRRILPDPQLALRVRDLFT